MWLLRAGGMVLLTILTSFYFFPFEFTFLSGVNTKMAMAGFGVILLGIDLARKRKSLIDRDFFQLSLWAAAVSLISFFAVVWNDTHDYTYASYLVSMWVWMAGAYVVVQAIRGLHGGVSVELVCNYLIVVCVAQCLIAFAMSQIPALKHFVDGFLGSTGFMGKMEDRMYGIGASLDVAGSRFSVILVMIAYLMTRIAETSRWRWLILYLGAFFIVTVIGNMMSRTTSVGAIVALCYLFWCSKIWTLHLTLGMRRLYGWLAAVLLVAIGGSVYGYQTNPAFRSNLRFGFEGFFSLVEEGRWDVHSNEILKNMYVFPDNTKTWLIGDGYFENPNSAEPYYVGPNWGGYYKGTDVGYLRFIYYFGIIGLAAFAIYMYKAGRIGMTRFPLSGSLFLMILLLNYAVWFKVSSDLFLVFALFLCIGAEENREYEQLHLTESSES